jgi:hypothetical protein
MSGKLKLPTGYDRWIREPHDLGIDPLNGGTLDRLRRETSTFRKYQTARILDELRLSLVRALSIREDADANLVELIISLHCCPYNMNGYALVRKYAKSIEAYKNGEYSS